MKKILSGVTLMMASLVPLLLTADPLTPNDPVELTGTQGKFDFIKIDSANRRLVACHTKNGTLDVIDVDSSKLIKSVPTGAAQGVAIDDKNGRYFVSVSKPPQLVIVDSAKLEVIGQAPLPAPADLVAYHPESDRVFVCNDEKPELWIIDPAAAKIVTTLSFPGAGMEDLGFDPQGKYLFQNLKETNQIVKVDPAEAKIVATWSTSPADKPHGLAMLSDSVLVAGGTGKLSLLDLGTGQVLASTDIAMGVDEVTYDPGLQRAYCAAGSGSISIVAVGPKQLTTLATIPSPPGTHSIAVDPQTHTVWIVFAKDNKAYVQAFTAK